MKVVKLILMRKIKRKPERVTHVNPEFKGLCLLNLRKSIYFFSI